MDCKQVKEELVFLFIDNEMGQEILIAYHEHISHCPHCAQELRYTRRLIATVRRTSQRQPAPDRLRKRILSSMPHRLSAAQREV